VVDYWSRNTLKSVLVPGGAVWLAAVVLLQAGIYSPPVSAVATYYWVEFLAGFLLAWRFHSSRAFLAVGSLLLAQRALVLFSAGRATSSGQGHIALAAIAILLPLNLLLLALVHERGLTVPSIAPWLGLLFIESVFVAILCRPGEAGSPSFLRLGFFPASWFHWSRLPQSAWMAFAITSATLLIRLFRYRKPIESGLLWSLAAAFLGLQAGGAGRIGSAYFATGGLILACSMVENSYLLAYQDELTSLPARRAFNDALMRLQNRYTVAVVDIDHFKKFNDTYGHETGDEVLRMVAAKLARVSGGGQAFRVGGEEFTILFSGESLPDVLPHLEILRMEIEASSFRVRGGQERRAVSHGTDRRKAVRSRRTMIRRKPAPAATGGLSVTVSIGVAEPNARARHVEQVIQTADQALYRAKRAGRNRIEVMAPQRVRLKRSIA
jgi:diguanylate cyclase (GGDEF)-like protein